MIKDQAPDEKGLSDDLSYLCEGERIDDLQRGGYRVIQHPGKFCFGIDAVLLSGFCRLKAKDKVVDLGTGTGILPLLLAAKTKARHFTGLEIQKDMAEMASRSVSMNGLEERISIIHGDLRDAAAILGKNGYEAVVANPPYYKLGSGMGNPGEEMRIARHEVCCTLEDVVREAGALLKQCGRFYLICTSSRLTEATELISLYGMKAKRLRLVHPYSDANANLFMLEAVKGAKEGLVIEPPLVVYRGKGIYTDEVLDIYNA